MRYVPFYLEKEEPTGIFDKLGNEITTKKLSELAYAGRFTEWTAEDVTLLGREMTSGTRKMLCNKITSKQAKMASRIKIDDNYYTIKSVKDLGRWRLFVIVGYRL